MKPEYPRSDRLNRQIAKVLSETLLRETNDPRLQKINITRVELTQDKSLAKVYYTLMAETEGVEGALEKASGFLRSNLAKRLVTRRVPTLRFCHDEVLLKARRIEDLLNNDKREK